MRLLQDTMNKKPKGKFIVIEGPEGAGKSLLASSLLLSLLDQGIPAILSKEPGTAFEGKLRKLILEGNPSRVSELFLFLADRAEHIHTVVKPALDAGTWVILDRFSDSTVIYQSIAKQVVDVDTCRSLCSIAEQDCIPDQKLLVFTDFSVCRFRLESRADQVKRLAQQGGLELELAIYQAYANLQHDPGFTVLNGNTSAANVLFQANLALSSLVDDYTSVAQKQ